MEIIQSVTKDFILYLRKELHDVVDLHFESTAGGAITIVYISSIVNQREIESNFLEPLSSILVDGNGQGLNGGSDIIDFGEQLRVQHFQVWNRIAWKKVYPTVDFQVDLQVHIWGNGVLY